MVLRALCLLFAMAAAWPGHRAFAQDVPLGAALRQENGFLRIQAKGREVRLESLIVRPEGATGRLPLAIITHGRNSSSLSMGDLRAARYATLARDLARRGWLAAVVMRRGAGQSDGPLPSLASCPAPDVAGSFGDDADDIEGALRVLQARPDVDGQRVILLGESAGGATAMALMRRKPPGLRGVVNVAGGLNLEGCTERGQDALVAAMTAWQGPDAVPQLWIYARNDELFPPAGCARRRSMPGPMSASSTCRSSSRAATWLSCTARRGISGCARWTPRCAPGACRRSPAIAAGPSMPSSA